MQKVIFLSKEKLRPKFGCAVVSKRTVVVRRDLSRCLREFVLVHELYHLQDNAHWWVWRERKANIAAALKEPNGFIVCILMSLAAYLLSYYCERITGEDD